MARSFEVGEALVQLLLPGQFALWYAGAGKAACKEENALLSQVFEAGQDKKHGRGHSRLLVFDRGVGLANDPAIVEALLVLRERGEVLLKQRPTSGERSAAEYTVSRVDAVLARVRASHRGGASHAGRQ